MGLGLPRYQLLPSGYEDLGQCVQLRLSFQLLRYGLELPRYLPSEDSDRHANCVLVGCRVGVDRNM